MLKIFILTNLFVSLSVFCYYTLPHYVLEMDGNESSECTICGINIKPRRFVTYKVSSCYVNLGVMDNACAKKYHRKQYPNSSTPFCLETWSKSLSIKMLYFKCRVNCLFCNSRHALNDDNIIFVQCSTEECTSWSYYRSFVQFLIYKNNCRQIRI